MVAESLKIDSRVVMKMDADYVMHTYGRQPVVFVRGEGMRLWDADGKSYLDFLSGIAVDGLGHSHPKLAKAIGDQARELMHVCNLFYVPQQPELAKRLVEISGLGKAFFCNSGAEANEAALKLARKWASVNRGEDVYEIVTAEGSFHGRTFGAVTATGQPKYHKGFEPMVPGFKYVPYNSIEALEAAITEKTCAIMLEPIQGESGVKAASLEYLKRVRQICTEKNILLILDEVQTGLGRTGKWFGFQHYGIMPDIMSLAKTLGGGFPIGACLATDAVASAFEPGNHASTFGGNPLACTAALAFLDIMEEERLLENAAETGAYFLRKLRELKDNRSDIIDIRGLGFMAAIEMSRTDAAEVGKKCLAHGLVLNPIGASILRFLPPLITKNSDVDEAIDILSEVLEMSD